MTQLNQRVSVGFNDDEWDRIQELKQIYFDKTYAQVVKDLILKGLDIVAKEQKARPIE